MNIVDALNAPTAIVGTTGAGKTFTAKGAVEELLEAKRRVVIIDPTGAWWGLRSGADGNPDGGYAVTIFGGDHADIPIGNDHGATVADAIARREVQAIIDTSEMTGGEKTRFLTDFLQTLYAKNKAALYLVVDEADEVCPQNPMPEERRLSGAFDKIVRRGRIKGFRPLMITQRPAVLHKNVLSQIGTLIALKLTSPQDRKAIEDWVKGNADEGQAKIVMTSLPTLPRGEGWLWSPAADVLERRQFPAIKTFDSSRTPGADEAVLEPALSPVDVDALRLEMAIASPEPKTGKASAVDLQAAELRGYERGKADGFKEGRDTGFRQASHTQMLRVVDAMVGAAMLTGHADALEAALASMKGANVAPEPVAVPQAAISTSPVQRAKEPQKPSQRVPAAPARATSNPDGQERLLCALSPTVGTPWDALALRAGYVFTGGGFRAAKAALQSAGRVREIDGLVFAIERPEPRMPSREELVEFWASRLKPGPGTILRALHEAGAEASVSGLAAATGYVATGGGFRAALKALRSSGVVTQVGDVYRLSVAFCGAAA